MIEKLRNRVRIQRVGSVTRSNGQPIKDGEVEDLKRRIRQTRKREARLDEGPKTS